MTTLRSPSKHPELDLSWLQRRCRNISIDVSGVYFEFDSARLHVECPWRIVAQGRIVLGSVDYDQKFAVDAAASLRELVGDHAVEQVQVLSPSSDLVVDFGDGLRLEIWNNSSGYEGWSAYGPDKQQIVALGGGELASFKA